MGVSRAGAVTGGYRGSRPFWVKQPHRKMAAVATTGRLTVQPLNTFRSAIAATATISSPVNGAAYALRARRVS